MYVCVMKIDGWGKGGGVSCTDTAYGWQTVVKFGKNYHNIDNSDAFTHAFYTSFTGNSGIQRRLHIKNLIFYKSHFYGSKIDTALHNVLKLYTHRSIRNVLKM